MVVRRRDVCRGETGAGTTGVAPFVRLGYSEPMEKPKYVVTVRRHHGMPDQPCEVEASTPCVRVQQDYENEYVIEEMCDGRWNQECPILVTNDLGSSTSDTDFRFPSPLITLKDCARGELVYAVIYHDSPGERTRNWMKWEVVEAATVRP